MHRDDVRWTYMRQVASNASCYCMYHLDTRQAIGHEIDSFIGNYKLQS